jgi:hypothetical protein
VPRRRERQRRCRFALLSLRRLDRGIRFACDSRLEGDGFELSVPRNIIRPVRRVSSTRWQPRPAFARVGPASHGSPIRGASPCGSPWREVQQGQRNDQSAAGVPRRFLVVISRQRLMGGAENDAADRDSPDRKVDRPGIGIRSRAERAGAGYRPHAGGGWRHHRNRRALFAEAQRKRPNDRMIQAYSIKRPE